MGLLVLTLNEWIVVLPGEEMMVESGHVGWRIMKD